MTPQNWLFLGSYKVLRERLLRQVDMERGGEARTERRFEDMNWWAA